MNYTTHEHADRADTEPNMAEILRKAGLLGAAALMTISSATGVAVGAKTYHDVHRMQYENIDLDTLVGGTPSNK